jgi:hypothetical protein
MPKKALHSNEVDVFLDKARSKSMAHVIFKGSGPPLGLANESTNGGTQIGDDLSTIPQWYFNEVNNNTLYNTIRIQNPDNTTTPIATAPIMLQGVWGLINSAFGLQNSPSMSFPNVTSGACGAAGQALTKYMASHPGKPIPTSLIAAIGPACSGL